MHTDKRTKEMPGTWRRVEENGKMKHFNNSCMFYKEINEIMKRLKQEWQCVRIWKENWYLREGYNKNGQSTSVAYSTVMGNTTVIEENIAETDKFVEAEKLAQLSMEEAESGIEERRNHPVYIHIQNELMKCWAKFWRTTI